MDDDLVEAHKEYGPIDNLLHKGKKQVNRTKAEGRLNFVAR
jgi:hypothetical protein